MRIKAALVADSISKDAGGLNTSVPKLSQSMYNYGCVLPFILSGNLKSVNIDSCVQLREYSLFGPSFFGYSPNLFTNLKIIDPDIIHVHHLWKYPSIAVYRYAKKFAKPYIVAPRGMIDPWALKNSMWKKKLAGFFFENKHLEHASCLHALCESEAESMRDYGLTNPICIIPNGIDLPHINHRPFTLRQKSTDTRKNLLFLSRLHEKKGIENLIAAWSHEDLQSLIKEEGWCLEIVGWGDKQYVNKLKENVEQTLAKSTVIFLGGRFGREKQLCFEKATAFILPSYSEGLPIAVLEAWAYGLPVLISKQCNLPDGFANGAAVEVGTDVESIKSVLRKFILMSESERHCIGDRGRKLVAAKYSWEHVACQMYQVYNWVVGDGELPDCVYL